MHSSLHTNPWTAARSQNKSKSSGPYPPCLSLSGFHPCLLWGAVPSLVHVSTLAFGEVSLHACVRPLNLWDNSTKASTRETARATAHCLPSKQVNATFVRLVWRNVELWLRGIGQSSIKEAFLVTKRLLKTNGSIRLRPLHKISTTSVKGSASRGQQLDPTALSNLFQVHCFSRLPRSQTYSSTRHELTRSSWKQISSKHQPQERSCDFPAPRRFREDLTARFCRHFLHFSGCKQDCARTWSTAKQGDSHVKQDVALHVSRGAQLLVNRV